MRTRTRAAVTDWTARCAPDVAVLVLGGTWKPTIITLLAEHQVLRYGELSRLLGSVTARILTLQLRELESDGVIRRTVHPDKVARVEYELTELGRSAVPVIERLAEWGRGYVSSRQRPSQDR